MSEESNICTICGGVKRVDWTISFEQCHPVEMHFDPASLAGDWRLCPGHPEPAQKHDGRLDEEGNAIVEIDPRALVVISNQHETPDMFIGKSHESVYLTFEQALSLLVWLKQEEAELQRLAKEQEGGE